MSVICPYTFHLKATKFYRHKHRQEGKDGRIMPAILVIPIKYRLRQLCFFASAPSDHSWTRSNDGERRGMKLKFPFAISLI